MEAFEAIAQPTRREILRLLAGSERSVGEVVSRFKLSQPAISQHLKVLRESGLVNERREGTRRLYSVRAEGIADVHDFLAELLPAGLERLKRAAEAEQQRKADARNADRN